MNFWSQDSPVGTVMGYGLDGPGCIPSSVRFFSSRPAPAPTQPPIQWVLGALLQSKAAELTTLLHLMPQSRIVELYLHSPICHHGIMFK
jgi:hypothetical protein